MNLGVRIAALRKQKDMSQTDLAKAAGCPGRSLAAMNVVRLPLRLK